MLKKLVIELKLAENIMKDTIIENQRKKGLKVSYLRMKERNEERKQ